VTSHHHARLGAECSFFELDCQVFAQIRATLNPAAAPAAAPHHIPEAEELAEDFAEVLKYRGIETAWARRTAHSSMAVAIIERALF
jgi:hypothetical protein